MAERSQSLRDRSADEVIVVDQDAQVAHARPAQKESLAVLQEVVDALHTAISIANSGQGLAAVLESILTQLGRVVEYDSASITLLEQEGWRIIAGRGFPEGIQVVGMLFPPDDAKVAWMEKTGQPMVIGDVQQDPTWWSAPGLEYIRSWLGAPLFSQGRMIGILNLDKAEAGYYRTEDAHLVMAFANQMAVVVENARLFEAMTRRVAELEAVHEASLVVTSSLDLPQVLHVILEKTVELLPDVQDAHIFLYQDGQLAFGTALWADGRQAAPWAEPRPEGLTYTVARRGEAIFVPDMRNHPLFADTPDDWTGSIIGLPLKMGERVVG
ncbi:MAG TPA: GAF domain-containing protein, partial [Anaerolineae bacterium]|nr:GAF domain-containing protein [Anaerolineae bacterium]